MDDFEPTDGLEGDALRGARKRRIALAEAISDVEEAISSPAGEPGWRPALRAELSGLHTALAQHIEEVEGPEGLLAELQAEAPRLTNHIKRVEAEHPDLVVELDGVIDLADDTTVDAPVLRASVMAALASLSRHRQAGADLVYEAYEVDIGGG